MAKINKNKFLQQLETVRPGLCNKGIIEQSTCFVFTNGNVVTYNEEIFCRNKSGLPKDFAFAVESNSLLKVLSKLKEEDLEIEKTKKELTLVGKRKRIDFFIDNDISKLPIQSVEKPKDWKTLHPDFCEAVGLVQQCADRNDDLLALTSVHITPKWIEATDNSSMARYRLKTGVKEEILVKHHSIKHITQLEMTEFSETETWIHFRNASGLILSCRRISEVDYLNLSAWIKKDGEPATLPKGLADAAENAEIFSSEEKDQNQVKVELRPGKIRVQALGVTGKYSEFKSIKYRGKPLSFIIAPKLLAEIVRRYNDVFITDISLRVDGGKFTFIASLEQEKKQILTKKKKRSDEEE